MDSKEPAPKEFRAQEFSSNRLTPKEDFSKIILRGEAGPAMTNIVPYALNFLLMMALLGGNHFSLVLNRPAKLIIYAVTTKKRINLQMF